MSSFGCRDIFKAMDDMHIVRRFQEGMAKSELGLNSYDSVIIYNVSNNKEIKCLLFDCYRPVYNKNVKVIGFEKVTILHNSYKGSISSDNYLVIIKARIVLIEKVVKR